MAKDSYRWTELTDYEKLWWAPSASAQQCWDDRAYCSVTHPPGTPHQVDRWAAANAHALGDEDAARRIMAAQRG